MTPNTIVDPGTVATGPGATIAHAASTAQLRPVPGAHRHGRGQSVGDYCRCVLARLCIIRCMHDYDHLTPYLNTVGSSKCRSAHATATATVHSTARTTTTDHGTTTIPDATARDVRATSSTAAARCACSTPTDSRLAKGRPDHGAE